MDTNPSAISTRRALLGAGAAALTVSAMPAHAEEPKQTDGAPEPVARAFISGAEDGFRALTSADFTKVNSADNTWSFEDELGLIHCTGKPTSVMRTVKPLTNFEITAQWMHHEAHGNSGFFVWTTPASIERLTAAAKPGLPHGIEVQVLSTGYREYYEKHHNKNSGWFTSHGDVFPVGVRMRPFPPLSPDKSRSFPSKETTRPAGQWNHYYVRAINGEVRLWVNGEEVSGGNGCDPATGFLCLESEGSPITFKNLRLRELP